MRYLCLGVLQTHGRPDQSSPEFEGDILKLIPFTYKCKDIAGSFGIIPSIEF